MKKVIFLLVINVLFTSIFFGQDKIVKKVGDIIILDADVKVSGHATGYFTGTVDSSKTWIEGSVKFRVISITDTVVELRALNFDTLTKNQAIVFKRQRKTDKSKYYNDMIFPISKSDFELYSTRVESSDRISFGLLTLPFKARPQNNFSFDTEFNLSTTLNWRLGRINNMSLNIQLGAGIGSVGLNASNASGIDSEENEAQDVAILTFLGGAMIQYKNVQFGFYAGVDQINNQSKYRWESNGNIWFGVGIGYNIFNISVSKTTLENKNK